MATGDPWCETHGFSPCRCRELPLIGFGVGVGKPRYFEAVMNEERLKRLETFYSMIRQLANSANLNQYQLIYEALSTVDPKWNEGPTYNPQPDWGAGHGGEG